jgi:hypothetical protein
MATPSNREIVLIAGLPRTGGTMLSFMLDGWPGVYPLPFELDPRPTARPLWAVDREPSARLRLIVRTALQRPPVPPGAPVKATTLFRAYARHLTRLATEGRIRRDNHLASHVTVFYEAMHRPIPKDRQALVIHSPQLLRWNPLDLLRDDVVGRVVYLRRRDLDWFRSFYAHVGMGTAGLALPLELLVSVKVDSDRLAAEIARDSKGRLVVVDYEPLTEQPGDALARLGTRLSLRDAPEHDPTPTFLGAPVAANSSSPTLARRTGVIPSSQARPGLLPEEIEEAVRRRFAEAPRGPATLDVAKLAQRVCAQWEEVREYRQRVKLARQAS